MSVHPSLLVVHTGDFGAAVAAEVRRRCPQADTLHADSFPEEARCSEGELVVLATNRPRVDMEAAVDRWATERRRLLVPIALEHPYLRVGPVLGPDAHATLECYRQRLRQHSWDREVRRMAEAQYAVETTTDLRGYLPTLVTLAVGAALDIGRRLAGGEDDELQQVRLLDVYSLTTRRSRLIGRHGNARSAHRDAEADRSYRALLPMVRQIAAMRGAR